MASIKNQWKKESDFDFYEYLLLYIFHDYNQA